MSQLINLKEGRASSSNNNLRLPIAVTIISAGLGAVWYGKSLSELSDRKFSCLALLVLCGDLCWPATDATRGDCRSLAQCLYGKLLLRTAFELPW